MSNIPYCIIEQGKANFGARNTLSTLLSIDLFNPKTICRILCTSKTQKYIEKFPYSFTVNIEWYIVENQDLTEDYNKLFSKMRVFLEETIDTYNSCLLLDSETLLVRPITIPDTIVKQVIGFIKRKVITNPKRPEEQYSNYILYFNTKEWVRKYTAAACDIDNVMTSEWYTSCKIESRPSTDVVKRQACQCVCQTLVNTKSLNICEFFDENNFMCTTNFFAVDKSWKVSEIDTSTLSRKDVNIELLRIGIESLLHPRLSPIIKVLIESIATYNKCYSFLFSLKFNKNVIGIRMPPLTGLAHWDRTNKNKAMRNLLNLLCELPYFTPEQTNTFYSANGTILYDAMNTEYIIPDLINAPSIDFIGFADSLLNTLNKFSKETKINFLGYLPEHYDLLNEEKEITRDIVREGALDNAFLPSTASDEEYKGILRQLRGVKYLYVHTDTRFIAEALALGVVPVIDDMSVSKLLGLTEGIHYETKNVKISEYAEASKACIDYFDKNCSNEEMMKKLVRHILIWHIESSNFERENEVTVVSVDDTADIIEETDS
jgi:hypothetical protein